MGDQADSAKPKGAKRDESLEVETLVEDGWVPGTYRSRGEIHFVPALIGCKWEATCFERKSNGVQFCSSVRPELRRKRPRTLQLFDRIEIRL